jgi:hypothetical protein
MMTIASIIQMMPARWIFNGKFDEGATNGMTLAIKSSKI